MPIARTTRFPGGTGAWPNSEAGRDLRSFVARLIALRQQHPNALLSGIFFTAMREPAPGIFDIAWFEADGELIPGGLLGTIPRSVCCACAAPPATTTARFRC